MNELSHLEEQINELNLLNNNSSKTLELFADTSNAISVRARSITNDIQRWEVAQDNIVSTIAEMSRAARCYHPPPVLPAVISKKEQKPEMIARCIDYLVYTSDYLQQHPSNVYSDKIVDKIEDQLETIVQLSEDIIRKSFIRALDKPQKKDAPAGSSGVQPLPSPSNYAASEGFGGGAVRPGGAASVLQQNVRVINNPEVLEGVQDLISRLRENFNRVTVVQNEVRALLQDKMASIIDAQFDASYNEERFEKVVNNPNTANAMKHYQRGDHRLVGISALARRLVLEVSDNYSAYVLKPLDDAFEVAEIPGDMAALAFRKIIHRANEAIATDSSIFQDPTRMFVDSRGQGIGLYPGRRYFRDILFIGLDLVEELWRWKQTAQQVSGEKDNFLDFVDSELELFLAGVQELISNYEHCTGALEGTLLREYTKTLRRSEWMPALDCTAHESATNLLYLHKVMLTDYYGALKLALFGTALDSTSDAAAVQAVESFLMQCVLGTMSDLQVVVETATEVKHDPDGDGKHRGLHHRVGNSTALWNKEVFLVNNIVFLLDNYKKEPCFISRTMEVDVEPGKVPQTSVSTRKDSGEAKQSKRGKRNAGEEDKVSVSIVENILQVLTDDRERYVDDYGETWNSCFPTISDDPVLESVSSTRSGAGAQLGKSQRMAVKHWYKSVSSALSVKLLEGNTHAVMDSVVRSSLIEVALTVVQDNFGRMQDALAGRVWSKRPLKWLIYSEDEWIERMKRMF